MTTQASQLSAGVRSQRTRELAHVTASIIIPALGTALALTLALRQGVSSTAIWLLVVGHLLSMLGIELGYHRHLAHKAFSAHPYIRVVLLALGATTAQGPALYWASLHRRHHALADTEDDPHSPRAEGVGLRNQLLGIWNGYMGWMFKAKGDHRVFAYVENLSKDRLLLKIDRMYFFWLGMGLVVPTLIGGAVEGTWRGAAEGFLWGGLVRAFTVQQYIWLIINTLCHRFGSRAFNTKDRSRNQDLLAFLFAVPGWGLSWHNNHHAFSTCATVQLKWWHIDPGYWLLLVLRRLGLVWDLRLPSAKRIELLTEKA